VEVAATGIQRNNTQPLGNNATNATNSTTLQNIIEALKQLMQLNGIKI